MKNGLYLVSVDKIPMKRLFGIDRLGNDNDNDVDDNDDDDDDDDEETMTTTTTKMTTTLSLAPQTASFPSKLRRSLSRETECDAIRGCFISLSRD